MAEVSAFVDALVPCHFPHVQSRHQDQSPLRNVGRAAEHRYLIQCTEHIDWLSQAARDSSFRSPLLMLTLVGFAQLDRLQVIMLGNSM